MFPLNPQLHEFGVFDEHAIGGHQGDDEALLAIQKSAFEKIGFKKSPRGPEEEVSPVELFTMVELFTGRNGREAVQGVDMIGHVIIGEMIQGKAERLDGAIDKYAVMRFAAFTMSLVFLKEAEFGVGIPLAMVDPFA